MLKLKKEKVRIEKHTKKSTARDNAKEKHRKEAIELIEKSESYLVVAITSNANATGTIVSENTSDVIVLTEIARDICVNACMRAAEKK